MKLKLVCVSLLSLGFIAGCASTSDKSDAGADAKGGAATSGAGDTKSAGGSAVGDSAALLAKKRVHFEFDSSKLDDESKAIVQAHSKHLASNANLKVKLEGHTDERGSREYNLALGERRAKSVNDLMKALNIDSKRVSSVSFGEEKPMANDHNEAAWRQNRRVEIQY
jgi:peptidoglycan-associated lipoprotein